MIQYFNPGSHKAGNTANEGVLTEKEAVVCRLLKDGLSYESIARHMGISIDGVRYHVKHLYKKLGVKRRGELPGKDLP